MKVEPDQPEDELPMLKLPNSLQEILCTTNSSSSQECRANISKNELLTETVECKEPLLWTPRSNCLLLIVRSLMHDHF
ncbi:hypothetical protein EMCRGX_G023891 [Ephydatia muelleri]